jgi:hypothetical protein
LDVGREWGPVPTGCGKACKRVDACFSIENSCWSPGFIMLTECPIHAGWKNLITVMASLSLSHYEVYFAFTNSTKLNEIIEEKLIYKENILVK